MCTLSMPCQTRKQHTGIENLPRVLSTACGHTILLVHSTWKTSLGVTINGFGLQYLEYPHSVIEMLLNDGEGLTLGPDSDGLLNFCDTPMYAQPGTQAGPSSPAAPAKGKGSAASSEEVMPLHSLLLGHAEEACGEDKLGAHGL